MRLSLKSSKLQVVLFAEEQPTRHEFYKPRSSNPVKHTPTALQHFHRSVSLYYCRALTEATHFGVPPPRFVVRMRTTPQMVCRSCRCFEDTDRRRVNNSRREYIIIAIIYGANSARGSRPDLDSGFVIIYNIKKKKKNNTYDDDIT